MNRAAVLGLRRANSWLFRNSAARQVLRPGGRRLARCRHWLRGLLWRVTSKDFRWNINAPGQHQLKCAYYHLLLTRFRNETNRAKVERPDNAGAVLFGGQYHDRNRRIA